MSQAGARGRAPGAFDNSYQSSHHYPSHPNNAPAGAKAHIFQPPRTPSTSSSNRLGRSAASLYSLESDRSTAAGRKRSRTEYTNESCATPVAKTHGWSAGLNASDVMETSLDIESPAPFVSTRYELAGGLDTPSAYAETRREIEEREYFDTGFRRGFGDAGITSRPHAQLSTQSETSDNWSKATFNIMGGVVGKVLDFCKSLPFRGFYAGGGKGYDITQPQLLEENGYWRKGETEKITVYNTGRHPTPLPGCFPEDEIIGDYMLQPQERTPTPPRASKRRHVETTDLGNSWIMVAPDTPPQSPSRTSGRYGFTTNEPVRRRSTASVAGRGAHRGHVARRSINHISRASISHAGSPALLVNNMASFAPTRSPTTYKGRESPTRTSPTRSPVSKEAQKWAAKKKKEDREAEESIKRLDRQLKTMIREGKEALGSKIEIEGDDECLDDFDDPDFFDGRLN